jgi:hypothetical protein
MSATINIRSLKRFETGEDGASIVLFAEDSGGQLVALHLPLDCISALIMTLPRMVNAVVRQRAKDQSLRLVYPLAGFSVELSADRHTRILTLKTPDGFEVSFAVSEYQYRRIKCGHSHGAEVPERKVN